MRHRLHNKVFDGKKYRSSSASETGTLSTFTTSQNGSGGNPHSAGKNKLHSKSTYFYRWCVPSVCGLALLFGGIVTINPSLSNNVFATDEEAADEITENNDGIAPVADPVINLTITADSGNTNSNVTVGEVAYFSNTVTVSGTGINKYYLTLSSPSGSTGNLVGQKNPAATVGKVGNGTTPANFGDNTWGYAVSTNTSTANSALSYNPVPSGSENGNAVFLATKTSAPASTGDKYKLVFAAKLGAGLPDDHYRANVYVSAVTNATAIASIGFTDKNGNSIVNMQDMTNTLCANANVGTTGRLIDTRDSKIYWVTKLADEQCWMTQNLDYDDPNSTKFTAPSGVGGSSTARQYYDPGEVYYAFGKYAVNIESSISTEDLHYHIGNYYSWNSVTNGTGGTSTSGDASGSICPTNWQLPTSNNASAKSFRALMVAYNLLDSGNIGLISAMPLYFVYGGYIFNRFESGGQQGYYWSSTRSSNAGSVYDLRFSSSGVELSTSFGNNRSMGLSARCVAK